MANLKPVKRWSFSSWSLFDQCPSKYKKQRLEGRPVIQIESPALVFGKRVHAEAEDFLKRRREDVSADLKHFEKELINMRAWGAVAEEPFVFDREWHPLTDWDDPNAWVRGMIDMRLGDLVVDFKTGKHYEDHQLQAELYALATFIQNPDMKHLTVEFWYTKFNAVRHYEFDRNMMDDLFVKWNERGEAMMIETVWAPKENKYCDWCEFQPECELFNGDEKDIEDLQGIDYRTLLEREGQG